MLTPGRIALISQNPPAPPAPTFTAGPVLAKGIGRRKQWLPSNPQIDWSHPLAQGIVLCVAATSQGGIVRLDTRQLYHKTNTSNLVHLRPGTGPFGPTVESNPAVAENSTPRLLFTSPLEGVPHSSMFVGSCKGGQVGGGIATLTRCIVTGSFGAANVGWTSESAVGFVKYQIGGPSFSGITLTANTTTVNEWFVGTMSSTTGAHTLWVNGRIQATATNNVLGSSGMAVDGLMYGGNPFDGQSTPGAATLVCFWSRALSANEHSQLAADPFCFLRSSSPQMFVNSAVPLFSNFKGWGIPL